MAHGFVGDYNAMAPYTWSAFLLLNDFFESFIHVFDRTGPLSSSPALPRSIPHFLPTQLCVSAPSPDPSGAIPAASVFLAVWIMVGLPGNTALENAVLFARS